jgi:hypothetical protein
MLITYAAMQVGKLRKRAVQLSLVEYVTARVITGADIRTAVSYLRYSVPEVPIPHFHGLSLSVGWAALPLQRRQTFV